ncbi:MAG: phage integrase N-terminal SAM-like domain-containing protein [Gammaproteobacteria bacterium]|nr:phage integrase N-terminal SAM-like domain-containing protein [Gammaproteobacteria bacterium]MCW9004797.1 phage integrase N-terminal SAM-like domain-containing protein [Gammaproteobacteria bacterium]
MSAQPRLLDQVRNVIRLKHYSIRTEKSYISWIKQYIKFHSLRHPNLLDATHVESFLSHLAVDRHVSASTQNQALNALVFLYKQVLNIKLEEFGINRVRSDFILFRMSCGHNKVSSDPTY